MSAMQKLHNTMLTEQFITLAQYNRWMNERLYTVCAELSDEARKADRQAFFTSIHGTLNHILLADKIWLGRFTGELFKVTSLDQELYSDFAELRAAREQMDQDIETWVASLTEAQLAEDFSYSSVVNPAVRTLKLWAAVTHFFNHQTHHRGQITTLLSQLDQDMGVTDLIWLPELMHEQ